MNLFFCFLSKAGHALDNTVHTHALCKLNSPSWFVCTRFSFPQPTSQDSRHGVDPCTCSSDAGWHSGSPFLHHRQAWHGMVCSLCSFCFVCNSASESFFTKETDLAVAGNPVMLSDICRLLFLVRWIFPVHGFEAWQMKG